MSTKSEVKLPTRGLFKPTDFEASVFKAGLHSAKPPFTFHCANWERHALPVLSESARGYVYGNAGAGETYAKNLESFKKYSIMPRRLRPSKTDKDGKPVFSDASTTVLGQKLDFPLAIAPVGVQKIFNREGEPATAKAAASVGIPYILSTAASTSIEDVAEANGPDATRWYQIYWPPDEYKDITISLLNRAKKAGYTALFVTVDAYILGWRPSDMDHGYNPFIHADRIGVEIGFTDPVFQKLFKERHGYDIDESERHRSWDVEAGSMGEAAKEWTSIVFPGHTRSWEDIAFLKEHWDGPIVIKGIQTVGDAKKCVEAGVHGIVVSNHGGRQQDGGTASLAVLPHIVDAVGDKLDIFFDSGVRSGADALKAIALGAKCVLIGRPYVYGLALGGEEGVRHVLRSLCGEMILNMHLAGLRTLEEVNREAIVKEEDLYKAVRVGEL
jgi:lactate 2-monooxygenase